MADPSGRPSATTSPTKSDAPKPSRTRPRYTSPIRLASGQVGWFFQVPAWAKARGCPVRSEPLGTDRDAAWDRAEYVLLPQLDSWRTAGASDLTPQRGVRGTFDWLVAEFRASDNFAKLDSSTKSVHEIGFGLVGNFILQPSGRRFGALAPSAITPKAVDRLYDRLAFVDDTRHLAPQIAEGTAHLRQADPASDHQRDQEEACGANKARFKCLNSLIFRV